MEGRIGGKKIHGILPSTQNLNIMALIVHIMRLSKVFRT